MTWFAGAEARPIGHYQRRALMTPRTRRHNLSVVITMLGAILAVTAVVVLLTRARTAAAGMVVAGVVAVATVVRVIDAARRRNRGRHARTGWLRRLARGGGSHV